MSLSTDSRVSQSCEICGETNSAALEKHRKLPGRYGGTYNRKNTVLLCSNCHRKIEQIHDDQWFEEVLGVTPDDDLQLKLDEAINQ